MSRLEKVVLFTCSAMVLIHAAASFFPEARLWGINQLGYMPFIPRWMIVILALALLVPKVNRTFYDPLARVFNLVESSLRRINRYSKYILFSFASIILFWVFKTNTHLLGDGSLRAGEILAGKELSFTAPLDFYLHALSHRYLSLEAPQTYSLLSCLAGAFFVFLALSLSYVLGKDSKEKVLAFVILTTTGSVQLFFGYVESYTLVYVGIMAYFLFSLWFLEGKCSLMFPGMALFFSIGLHLSALYLLPSLVYLGMSKSETEKRPFNFENLFGAIFVILLVGGGLFILSTHNPEKTSLASYFVSFSGNQQDPYSLFSGAHLLDVINEQLLLCPAGIILWVVVIFFARKIDFKDRVVTFFVIVSFFSLVFAFTVDPKLGYARDWDLFSSTGLGFTLLGIYLGFSYFRQANVKKLNYVILALIATAFLSTSPWIYVNAHEDKAVERFKDLLSVDLERSAYGHEILARYYRDMGLAKEEMEEWKKALSVLKIERYAGNLGGSYLKLGRYQEAAEAFGLVLRINPNSLLGYYNLGISLAHLGKYDQAKKQYQMAIDKDPYFLEAYMNLAVLFSKTGDDVEALGVLDSAIRINPDYFPAYENIAAIYQRIGNPREVIPLFRAYLERNPEDYQRIEELLNKMNIESD